MNHCCAHCDHPGSPESPITYCREVRNGITFGFLACVDDEACADRIAAALGEPPAVAEGADLAETIDRWLRGGVAHGD